jgi:hypothetical protein
MQRLQHSCNITDLQPPPPSAFCSPCSTSFAFCSPCAAEFYCQQGLLLLLLLPSLASAPVAKGGYVLPATVGEAAIQCTNSTYAPPFNRLRVCLSCQFGLAAPPSCNGPRSDKLDVCRVPPGKIWEGDALVDCPRGMYREGFVRLDNVEAISCKACPEGWTTEEAGRFAKRLCNGEPCCLLLGQCFCLCCGGKVVHLIQLHLQLNATCFCFTCLVCTPCEKQLLYKIAGKASNKAKTPNPCMWMRLCSMWSAASSSRQLVFKFALCALPCVTRTLLLCADPKPTCAPAVSGCTLCVFAVRLSASGLQADDDSDATHTSSQSN